MRRAEDMGPLAEGWVARVGLNVEIKAEEDLSRRT